MVESGLSNEKLILMYVPYALERIGRSQNVTVAELRYVKKNSPEFFGFIKGSTVEEHIKFLESYRNDSYFGIYIEKMLSPKGLEWLRKNFPLMKQVSEEDLRLAAKAFSLRRNPMFPNRWNGEQETSQANNFL